MSASGPSGPLVCILGFVTHLYGHNPAAVHTRFPDIFDSLESDSNSMTWLLLVVAQLHPEVG